MIRCVPYRLLRKGSHGGGKTDCVFRDSSRRPRPAPQGAGRGRRFRMTRLFIRRGTRWRFLDDGARGNSRGRLLEMTIDSGALGMRECPPSLRNALYWNKAEQIYTPHPSLRDTFPSKGKVRCARPRCGLGRNRSKKIPPRRGKCGNGVQKVHPCIQR